MKKILSFIVFVCILSTLTACGIVSSFFESNEVYVRCDKEGKPSDEGEYVLFGEYPQSLKAPDVEITETVDGRGYCLGADGEYYAKVVASPYKEEYTFVNGDAVSSGEVYYFKVEPIRWRILSENDGVALIFCDSVIENQAFDAGKNNGYEDSDVREWLNSAFYEAAFAELQREIIVCGGEISEDKVFLLSNADLMNGGFGFNSSLSEYDAMKKMQTTDYARANGAFMKTSEENYGNGSYWLRSPVDGSTNKAWRIDSAGAADEGYVNQSHYGVAPALYVKLG